jgi:hypothetical protein
MLRTVKPDSYKLICAPEFLTTRQLCSIVTNYDLLTLDLTKPRLVMSLPTLRFLNDVSRQQGDPQILNPRKIKMLDDFCFQLETINNSRLQMTYD